MGCTPKSFFKLHKATDAVAKKQTPLGALPSQFGGLRKRLGPAVLAKYGTSGGARKGWETRMGTAAITDDEMDRWNRQRAVAAQSVADRTETKRGPITDADMDKWRRERAVESAMM
jgi:hypothetical protein